MVKNKILPTLTLTAICIIVTLLLAVTNIFTAPDIERAKIKKTEKALREVYANGETFEPLSPKGKGLPESITEIYTFDDGGMVFKATVKGYKDGLVIMVGVSPDGKVTSTKFIESKETNGAEKKLNGAFNGNTADKVEDIIIAGSTKTSTAYKKAVTDSLNAFEILKGDTAK